MEFSMIRQAQMVAKLAKQPATAAQHKLDLLSVMEAADETGGSITPANYNEWLKTVVDMAKDEGQNISKRSVFADIAFEILDNDSLMDTLGGDVEKTKEKIVKVLWQSYQVSKAHNSVKQAEMVGKRAKEEEESGFIQTLRSSITDEEEEKAAAPLYQRAVVTSGSKNPYPPGSLRASVWDDAHKNGVSAEEEEIHSIKDVGPDTDLGMEDESSMSPDELARKITAEYGKSSDVDYDSADTPDIESRVDDLEDRIANLEDHEAGEHEGDAEFDDVADADLELDISDDESDDFQMPAAPPREPARTRSRANVVEPDFVEDEEQVKSIFHRAITSPRAHLSAALKAVEQEGSEAWSGVSLPTNPHPKKSQAYNAWNKGFNSIAAGKLGIKPPASPPAKSKSKR